LSRGRLGGQSWSSPDHITDSHTCRARLSGVVYPCLDSSRKGGEMAEQGPTEVSEAESGQVSEAQIAVHWREEGYYFPSAKFIGQANASDPGIFERFAEERFPECFKEYGDLLSWDAYWHTTLDATNPPFWKWFVGGRLNASYNCVDRHLAGSRNKAAIIWVPEPEAED